MKLIIFFTIIYSLNCVKSQPSKRQSHVNESAIIGGTTALINQYPFAVNLVITLKDAKTVVCGGSILNTKLILTSGACLLRFPVTISVSVGSSIFQKGQLYITNMYDIHPNYESTNQDYDAGVVILRSPMVFKGAKPTILVTEGSKIVAGTQVTVVGWGYASETSEKYEVNMKAVKVPVVAHADCEKAYFQFYLVNTITSRMFCAGDMRVGGKGPCEGDEGSPVVDSAGVQIGISSTGKGCAHADFPGIYTDLTSTIIRSWLRTLPKV